MFLLYMAFISSNEVSGKYFYYIFVAILMLFLVIFEIDKSVNFLRGDKSFRTLKRTKSRQKQNK